MPFDAYDEISAASDQDLPISPKKQMELVKIVNDLWMHITVQHQCSPFEAQLIAAWITTNANNYEGPGGDK